MFEQVDLEKVIADARKQLREELHLEAVAREVARLRARQRATPWQRFLERLPFTITMKKRAP